MSRTASMPTTLSAPTPLTPESKPLMAGPNPAPGGRHEWDGRPTSKVAMAKAPLPSDEILAMPPEQAAVQLLRDANPGAVAAIRERQRAIDAALGDLVELARIDATVPLERFMGKVATLIGERGDLDGQLRLLGEEVPNREYAAHEVLGLVKNVARFRSLAGLQAHRPGLLDRLRGELDSLDHRDHGLRSHLAVPAAADHPKHSAEWLAKMASYLRQRRDLVERIDRLDPRGDAGRAALVKDAVARAKPAALAEALAPTQPTSVSARIAPARQAVEALDRRIAATDPESRLFQQLQDGRQQAQDELQTLRQQEADERAAAAQEIVQRAIQGAHSGTFADVAALALVLESAGQHELARAVAAISHEDVALVYVVHELVFT